MSKEIELTVKVTMDEEQLTTLRLYQPGDAKPLETVLEETAVRELRRLFAKTVPLPVQNYLAKKNGLPPIKPERPKPPRKPARERKNRSQGGQALTPEPPVQVKEPEQAHVMG